MNCRQETNSIGCSFDTLSLLHNAIDALMRADSKPPSKLNRLASIEGKFRRRALDPANDNAELKSAPGMHIITLLHCVAASLWLNRAALGYHGEEPSHQALVTRGLQLLSQMRVCDAAWPLFIVACEARSDDRRRVVLGVIHRTVSASKSRHIENIRALIESAWIFDDLDENKLLEYNAKLRSLVRAGSWMRPLC